MLFDILFIGRRSRQCLDRRFRLMMRLHSWIARPRRPAFRLLEPVAVAIHLKNVDVVGEPVEQRAREAL